MAKIQTVSPKEADGSFTIMTDDGMVHPISAGNAYTEENMPKPGDEWPVVAATLDLSVQLDAANVEIKKLNDLLAEKDAAIDAARGDIEDLNGRIAELTKSIPDKLREAADHMEGKDHPSDPAVKNLDDLPSLDKLKPHAAIG